MISGNAQIATAGWVARASQAWKAWRKHRADMAELSRLPPHEFETMAQDLGVDPGTLQVAATVGDSYANLLRRRLGRMALDRRTIESAVLNDLHRCCMGCANKQECGKDLDGHSFRDWHAYCPNCDTLDHLAEERMMHRLRRTQEKAKSICAAWPV